MYIIYITFDNENEFMDYLPGMSAAAEIVIGKRTILEYFLEPVRNGFDNSLKES